DVDVGLDNEPYARFDLAAFYRKGAALLHTAEETPSEGDVIGEGAVHQLQTMLCLIQDDLAGHRGEDTGLHRGRSEVRIGNKSESNRLWTIGLYRPVEGIWHHAQHLFGTLVIFAAALALLLLFAGAGDELGDLTVFCGEFGG